MTSIFYDVKSWYIFWGYVLYCQDVLDISNQIKSNQDWNVSLLNDRIIDQDIFRVQYMMVFRSLPERVFHWRGMCISLERHVKCMSVNRSMKVMPVK